MKKICSLCRGTKKCSEMGFIEITCSRCAGTGYEDDTPLANNVKVANLLSKAEQKLNGEATKTEDKKAKRGRPKKAA